MESLRSSFLLPASSRFCYGKKPSLMRVSVSGVSTLSFASMASPPRRKAATTKRTSKAKKIPSPTTPTIEDSGDSSSTNTSVTPKKVLVPIGFGTEEMEAVVLVDVLRRAGAEVTVASVEPKLEIEASGGIKLVADASISTCSDQVFDLVVLPGGMPGSVRLRDCQILQRIVTKQTEENRLYGAISTAPAVTLQPWGLLRRKKTTCHPAFFDKLPTFWAVKTNLQVSGELTTSRGPGTSFIFALSLVEQLFGESVAKEVGESLIMHTGDDKSKIEEFNKADWSLDHTPRVLIPIAKGCEGIEVVTLVDILRRAKVEIVVASVERSLQISGSQSIKLVADKSIADASDSIYDIIILPGGAAGSERLQKSTVLRKLLKEQNAAGRIYGAISSSSTVLQRHDFLKEKRTVSHPSLIDKVMNEMVDGAKVVIDGKLVTCKGLASVADLGLAIVSRLFGHSRARSVAEGLVYDYPRS